MVFGGKGQKLLKREWMPLLSMSCPKRSHSWASFPDRLQRRRRRRRELLLLLLELLLQEQQQLQMELRFLKRHPQEGHPALLK